MDLRGFGVLDRAPDSVDVLADRARQCGYRGAADLSRDLAAGLEIAGRRDREAGFDHVDAKLLQLARDLQLGVGIEVKPRRLLAIAQRGVEDVYAVYV